ncbi:leucine zipper protein 2-like [Discoglossus pictus]
MDGKEALELEEKQREEMRSLQEAFTKQLNDVAEKAKKQQTTVNFLKTEMERKNKIIRDLQNENKSLKNKLMSGNKLCGLRAEESKRIQAHLRDIRYGKKDLISKAQQLTDLEQKLSVAKDEMEKASLDLESQLKALNHTVQLCLSAVLPSQPSTMNIIEPKPREQETSIDINTSTVRSASTDTENPRNSSFSPELHYSETTKEEHGHDNNCHSQNQLHRPPWTKSEHKHSSEDQRKNAGNLNVTEEKSL